MQIIFCTSMSQTKETLTAPGVECTIGGASRATEAGRATAKKNCDAFCLSKWIGINANGIAFCERATEDEICNEKFFREYATYLTAIAVTGSGTLFKSGTAAQYLSAIKDMTMKKFPDNRPWDDRVLDRWYPSLRVAVEKTVNRRRILNGGSIAEGSLPLA